MLGWRCLSGTVTRDPGRIDRGFLCVVDYARVLPDLGRIGCGIGEAGRPVTCRPDALPPYLPGLAANSARSASLWTV
jgi:hypothetical protein